MKDSHRTIAAFIAMAVFVVFKTYYFPCNCTVQPPSTPEVATTTGSKQAAPNVVVTMIDLGATDCVPCKMMAPIIEELKTEYVGKADIIFIDVWKDPTQAKKYGIRTIPTQIFFNADGKEFHRNTGFMDKKRIVEILAQLGVS